MAKSKTMYVIGTGDHSDYRMIYVTASKKVAEAYVKRFAWAYVDEVKELTKVPPDVRVLHLSCCVTADNLGQEKESITVEDTTSVERDGDKAKAVQVSNWHTTGYVQLNNEEKVKIVRQIVVRVWGTNHPRVRRIMREVSEQVGREFEDEWQKELAVHTWLPTKDEIVDRDKMAWAMTNLPGSVTVLKVKDGA